MRGDRPVHGFTDVDAQRDPQQWVRCLDGLQREPFYRAYKRRLAQLLSPSRGGRYLEVGAGTGADAAGLSCQHSVQVTPVDRSFTMVATACRRHSLCGVVSDATALPFGGSRFDGAWADRTFQHLQQPAAALREMARVTRSGGRIVVVDPDYDTQVVNVADQPLARRVLWFRADRMLRNGALGHRMLALFDDARLTDCRVDAMTLLVREPTAVDNVMGLRSWADTAHRHGVVSPAEAERWPRLLDEAAERGTFLYAVTFFLTAGVKRGGV